MFFTLPDIEPGDASATTHFLLDRKWFQKVIDQYMESAMKAPENQPRQPSKEKIVSNPTASVFPSGPLKNGRFVFTAQPNLIELLIYLSCIYLDIYLPHPQFLLPELEVQMFP